MTPFPIGIQRLYAIAALHEGLSIDDYVMGVLLAHAEQIRVMEIRAEKLSMRRENQPDPRTLRRGAVA